jgi:UDP-N-acetylmuramyl pentapeptide phosphotransferase/UDP-N-acetylglucosamine-1-phosphate transferase
MELLLTSGAFIISFVLVIATIPPILRVSHAKKLFDSFEERKIHTGVIPPMGGVAIFIGFTISSIVATDGISFDGLKYIIASVILMFFIGLKDDLLTISARKKLVVQIMAAVVLVVLGNIRFTSLQGILTIYEIEYFPSVFLSVFIIVVIINAFNLIDGIDGLASGIGMLVASTFGVWFYLSGYIQFAILSFALVGSLAGFFLFNVFGHKNKLFMGDTGSLIIGLVISSLVVKFTEFNIDKLIPFSLNAAPALAFAVIIVPLIDTIRVMTIRIWNKKSPFVADNNHIHHKCLKLFSSHLKVTILIVSMNALIIAIAYSLSLSHINVNFQFFLIFIVGIFLSQIPGLILRLKSAADIKMLKSVKQLN